MMNRSCLDLAIFLVFLSLSSPPISAELARKSNPRVERLYSRTDGNGLPKALEAYQKTGISTRLEKVYEELGDSLSGFHRERLSTRFSVSGREKNLTLRSLDDAILQDLKNAPKVIQDKRELEAQKFEFNMRLKRSKDKLRLFLRYLHTPTGSQVFVDELLRQIKRYHNNKTPAVRHRILYYADLLFKYGYKPEEPLKAYRDYARLTWEFNNLTKRLSDSVRIEKDWREDVHIVIETLGVINNGLGNDQGVLGSFLSEGLCKLEKTPPFLFYQDVKVKIDKELTKKEDILIAPENFEDVDFKTESVCIKKKHLACLSETGLRFINDPQADEYGLLHVFAQKDDKLLHYVLDPNAANLEDPDDRSSAFVYTVEHIGTLNKDDKAQGFWFGPGKFSTGQYVIERTSSSGTKWYKATKKNYSEIQQYLESLDFSNSNLDDFIKFFSFLVKAKKYDRMTKKQALAIGRRYKKIMSNMIKDYPFKVFDKNTQSLLANTLEFINHFLRESDEPSPLIDEVGEKIFSFYQSEIFPNKNSSSQALNEDAALELTEEILSFLKNYNDYNNYNDLQQSIGKSLTRFHLKKHPIVLPLPVSTVKNFSLVWKRLEKISIYASDSFTDVINDEFVKILSMKNNQKLSPQFFEIMKNAEQAVTQFKNNGLSLYFSRSEMAQPYLKSFQDKYKNDSTFSFQDEVFQNHLALAIRFLDYLTPSDSFYRDLNKMIAEILNKMQQDSQLKKHNIYHAYAKHLTKSLNGSYGDKTLEMLEAFSQTKLLDQLIPEVLENYIENIKTDNDNKTSAFLILINYDIPGRYLNLFPYLSDIWIDENYRIIQKAFQEHKKLAESALLRNLKRIQGLADIKVKNPKLHYKENVNLAYRLLISISPNHPKLADEEIRLLQEDDSLLHPIILKHRLRHATAEEFNKLFVWITSATTTPNIFIPADKDTSEDDWSALISKNNGTEVIPYLEKYLSSNPQNYRARLMFNLKLTEEAFKKSLGDKKQVDLYQAGIYPHRALAALSLQKIGGKSELVENFLKEPIPAAVTHRDRQIFYLLLHRSMQSKRYNTSGKLLQDLIRFGQLNPTNADYIAYWLDKLEQFKNVDFPIDSILKLNELLAGEYSYRRRNETLDTKRFDYLNKLFELSPSRAYPYQLLYLKHYKLYAYGYKKFIDVDDYINLRKKMNTHYQSYPKKLEEIEEACMTYFTKEVNSIRYEQSQVLNAITVSKAEGLTSPRLGKWWVKLIVGKKKNLEFLNNFYLFSEIEESRTNLSISIVDLIRINHALGFKHKVTSSHKTTFSQYLRYGSLEALEKEMGRSNSVLSMEEKNLAAAELSNGSPQQQKVALEQLKASLKDNNQIEAGSHLNLLALLMVKRKKVPSNLLFEIMDKVQPDRSWKKAFESNREVIKNEIKRRRQKGEELSESFKLFEKNSST